MNFSRGEIIVLLLALLTLCEPRRSSLTASETYEIGKYDYMNEEQWQCGASDFQRGLSGGIITTGCWDAAIDYNMCCVVHDDCYQVQIGKEYCDEQFCDCLYKLWVSRFSDCFNWVYSRAFCFALRFGSDDAYKSPPDLVDTNIQYTPALNITAKMYYKKLYRISPNTTRTLSNCAYNHNVCHLRMQTDQNGLRYEDCRDTLIECLDDSSAQLHYEHGIERKHVEEVIWAITFDALESGIKVIRKAKKIKKSFHYPPYPFNVPLE